MFCCELKFLIDICKKWVYENFTQIRLSLDLVMKKNLKTPLCYYNLCVTCGFELGVKKYMEQIQIKWHTMILLLKKNTMFYRIFLQKSLIRFAI